MRDVSDKVTTLRTAKARAVLRVTEKTIEKIKARELPKGDPLEIAKMAAIQAAKNTSQVIPYCHQIPLEFVGVEYHLDSDSITIDVQVKATHKTGVEMEAMTGASVAALTIYDMVKMLDDFAEMEKVSLISKKGGKSDYRTTLAEKIKASVIVLSDRVYKKEAEDRSGKIIVEKLENNDIQVGEYLVLPDEADQLRSNIQRLCEDKETRIVVTTGGTGIGPRDITADTIEPLLQKPLPGIAEAIRSYGQNRNQFAMMSRSLAGLIGNTIVVCLPGSTGGVTDAMIVLFPPLIHALKMMDGEGHEKHSKQAAGSAAGGN